ncbi:hypothetical protein LPJ64_002645 [Coemansia asiatica]|uniref:Ubiquitin-like domain-containing protein n=1 Tax=Coemansia asiatica TaxID=1052880 RepID=A0A9W7XN89_9FUNG|nr:hypothetical protein LPJ64_002645 [Coemansia asiatica]
MPFTVMLMEKNSNVKRAKVIANSSSKVEEFFKNAKKALQLKESDSINWFENSGGERIMEPSDSDKSLLDCDVDSGCTLYYVLKRD